MNVNARVVFMLSVMLGALPAAAGAQAMPAPTGTPAPGTAAGSSTITGYPKSISAGVITMIDGTSVFYNPQLTKFPNGRPTLASQIRATGTRVAQGNIVATEVDILK